MKKRNQIRVFAVSLISCLTLTTVGLFYVLKKSADTGTVNKDGVISTTLEIPSADEVIATENNTEPVIELVNGFNPDDYFVSEPVPDEVKDRMRGKSYPENGAKEISWNDLSYIKVLYYDFNDDVTEGELVVNDLLADDIAEIFRQLYNNKYPLESVKLVDDFGGSDDASMEANNTSCFNYRKSTGDEDLSNHAYGTAIDINPLYNPDVLSSGKVLPKSAENNVSRDTVENRFAITKEDLAYRLFTEHGFDWGGDFKNNKDYMHFEKSGPAVMANKLQRDPSDYDYDNNVIVVIDPGHGGSNDGAIYNNMIERNITMQVANAMRDELETYKGITVYMTHESTNDSMSIEDRLKFAADKNADYLFSLHFNASAFHTAYGSEVWIPMSGEFNTSGYIFGRYELDELTSLGLFNRGIKTRPNGVGDEYYGIMKFGEEQHVPSLIIEHAHMDNMADSQFIGAEERYKILGKADATAVAKYFGLSKLDGSVSYRGLHTYMADSNAGNYAANDVTPPEVCTLAVASRNDAQGTAILNITGADTNSPILYYALSIDGGATFSDYKPWTGTDVYAGTSPTTISVSTAYVRGSTPIFLAKVINQYDLETISNFAY